MPNRQMRVTRGTARRLRREAAMSRALQYGLRRDFFKHYWHKGATHEALTTVLAWQVKVRVEGETHDA